MTWTTRSSSSSSSSTNKFGVFEFNAEQENVEKLSRKMQTKFINPRKSRSSPISKYEFLQAFACNSNQPLSKTVIVDPINLDDEQEEDIECSPVKVSKKPLEIDDDDDDDGIDIDNHGKCLTECSTEMSPHQFIDSDIPGYNEFVESDYEFKDQSIDMLSDDDDDDDEDCSEINSSSSSALNPSEVKDYFQDQPVVDDSSAFKINGIEKVVEVFPDFIQYEDLYSTKLRLIFSCSSLKLEGSTINGTGEILKIEWEAEDIIKIESHWFGKIETAMIRICLKSRDSREAGLKDEKPGFRLLKFSVYDTNWSMAEEAIKLLDMRYADMWSTFLDIDTDNYGYNSALGRDSWFSHKHYFPIFDEAFDEVIYPKGEPDAVSISKRDVELLQPETFINDTIIDFYIKYLKNKLPIDEQKRFHFFNSFFFRKLADLDKDPSSACDGRAAFQRVRKWTRKVNLFEKDYILIPINYSLHWSLVVICHPGEVTCFKDEKIKESAKVPCILHMDSLKGSHKGLRNLFQSYLCEEWKERHSNMVDDFSSKFLQLRFISLELPQQDNFYDCGLFLLHYVERFLKEAPIDFNPAKITKFSNFLNCNWFPPPEASLKRSHIQNLIHDIFENNSSQAPPVDCHGKGSLSEIPSVIKHRVEADSPGDCCYPAMWHGNPSNLSTDPRTDIHFPTASPIRVASCLKEPGFVFEDLQTEVVSSHSDCLQMSACHQKGFLSPIEETEEFDEEIDISTERENSQLVILASDFPSTSYMSKDNITSEILRKFSTNSVETVEHYSKASAGVSLNTLDTGALECQALEKIDESNTSDPDNRALEEDADCVVQDSQDSNDGHEIDVCVKSRSSFQENMSSLTPEFFEIFDLDQNTSLENDNSVNKEELLASESNREDAKRRKCMNALEADADCVVQEEQLASESNREDAKRRKCMNALEEDADCVVQDSQEANDGHEIDVCVKSRSSFQENMNSLTSELFEIFDLDQNMSLENDTSVNKNEQLASESDREDAKRRKPMNAAGGRSPRFTRSMSKEPYLIS